LHIVHGDKSFLVLYLLILALVLIFIFFWNKRQELCRSIK
jgi:hypothetical protein